MNPVAYIKKAITHPDKIVTNLGRRGLLNWMSDEAYIKLLYYSVFRKMPDLDNPTTFSEKIQWLKLHDRNPLYTKLVDKYEVKQYVGDVIGDEYIIPTLGVWDKFDDIDFDSLPDRFVLKCTHDSGGIVICKDKKTLDINAAKKKINRSLKQNFFYFGREWPYKNVKPRIIAEKYMEDTTTEELRDYKIFTFDGVAKALFIAKDRMLEGEDTKFDFYDVDFNHLDFRQGHPNASIPPEKPETYNLMIELAEKLGESFPQVRVDFYEVNGKAYFGELTFAHFSGLMPFEPSEWDEKFGSWIKLPKEFGGGYCIIKEGLVLWAHQKKSEELKDYKFFCFGGEAKCFKVDFDRFIEHHANYYDIEKRQLNFGEELCPPVYNNILTLPDNIEAMRELARKLSNTMPFLRADFYSINGDIYFGELTFYPASGFGKFIPNEWDKKLGEWIKLPKSVGGGYGLLTNDYFVLLQTPKCTEDDVNLSDIKDYKFWCFNGKAEFCQVISNRHTQETIDFFDREWNLLPFTGLTESVNNSEVSPARPINYDEMKSIAEKIALNNSFLRVDLYNVNHQVFFGEITFYPNSGMGNFRPEDWNDRIGKLISL